MMPRYALGERAVITVQVLDSNDTPALPAAAPVLRVYSDNGATISDTLMPPLDESCSTGQFRQSIVLDESFTTGVYSWRASATANGTSWVQEGYFEIVGGGGQDGAIISMFFLDAPAVTHLLYQVDSDDSVMLARNPTA